MAVNPQEAVIPWALRQLNKEVLSTVGFSNEDNCCQLHGIGKLIKEKLSKGFSKLINLQYHLEVFTHKHTVKPHPCQRVLPRIHRGGTNSSTSSWTDATARRGKLDAVYCGEETIEANFFCKEVFPY